MYPSVDQQIDDLAMIMIRDSINNARANLAVAIEAAKRGKLGNRLTMQDQFTHVNPLVQLEAAHKYLQVLESTWKGVGVPDPQPNPRLDTRSH